MSENSEKSLTKVPIASDRKFRLMYFIYRLFSFRHTIADRLWYACYRQREPLRRRKIHLIESVEECQKVINLLREQTSHYNVVGFDCEWIQEGGRRRPVGLLQLASFQGDCALIRLSKMNHFPQSLREFLGDKKLVKVGVAPSDDAQKLAHDYGVIVPNTFDIRYLAALAGYEPNGLANLTAQVFDITLDKDWRISCSNWEAPVLNATQLDYAANDAILGIQLFFRFAKDVEPRVLTCLSKQFYNVDLIEPIMSHFYNLNFKRSRLEGIQMGIKIQMDAESFDTRKKALLPKDIRKRHYKSLACSKSKLFYHNCLLQAPDGDLLCTIDYKRACWYQEMELGTVVATDPFTVRLCFEPSGRAVGDVGRFYQTPKENHCVVCGNTDSFVRKNVVPREYRKHFPEVMKKNTSHDVLLLCLRCHCVSDIANLVIRDQLAKECDAPLQYRKGFTKYNEDPNLRKVRGAAVTIKGHRERLPIAKLNELETILKNYYNVEELTDEMIQTAATIETKKLNENYTEHGLKVVQTYENHKGGLVELEKLWRQHFITSMEPKYLPKLWSINHNADRLAIRAEEGRVSEEELRAAGVKAEIIKPKEKRELASVRLDEKTEEEEKEKEEENENTAQTEENDEDQK